MKYLAAWFCLFVPLRVADANVFAAHLRSEPTATGYEFRYRLNEPATSVTISIHGPHPSNAVVREVSGGISKGMNLGEWDLRDALSSPVPSGVYNWSVTAVDTVGHHAKYDQLSDDAATTSKYYFGTGVCANTDQSSDYFGCVYVSAGESGMAGGRATTEGIYILNNDFSPHDDQGDVGHTGGVAWSTSWFSPMRIRLDGAGNPVISDWSEDHSGLWIATPDCRSPFGALLDEENRNVQGLCTNHGSIMTVWADGSGIDRIVYTIDEDYTVADEGIGSILRYEVGNAVNFSATPMVEFNNFTNGNLIVSTRLQHVQDESGWWIAQSLDNQSASAPWLIHWNGSTVDYNSGFSGLGITRSYGALAIDPSGGRLVLAGLGKIALLNITSVPATAVVKGEIDAGGDLIQDVAFDAAGNFIQINSSSRRLQAYSPDDGANSFMTRSPNSQLLGVGVVSTGVSDPAWTLYK